MFTSRETKISTIEAINGGDSSVLGRGKGEPIIHVQQEQLESLHPPFQQVQLMQSDVVVFFQGWRMEKKGERYAGKEVLMNEPKSLALEE